MGLLPRNDSGGIIFISRIAELPGVGQSIQVPRYLLPPNQAQAINCFMQTVHNMSTRGVENAELRAWMWILLSE